MEPVEQPLSSIDSAQVLVGILALLADERRARVAQSEGGETSTEVLLSDVGLDNSTIGLVVRKKPNAVRMAISRAKKAADQA